MGDPVDLTTQPIFIARELYYYPDFQGYKVALGKEGSCSYYTNVMIIEGPVRPGDDIKELRRRLLQELENSGGRGE